MHVVSILLFGISANIDNFTVEIAYGIKKIKIGIASNFLIAVISGIGTFISMSIGFELSRVLNAASANAIGSTILIILGIWTAKDYFVHPCEPHENDEKAHRPSMKTLSTSKLLDINKPGALAIKESITLALALTINNFGLGIGSSITGLKVYATVMCTFVLSVIMITVGCLLGNGCISRLFDKLAPLISGAVIIVLGIYKYCCPTALGILTLLGLYHKFYKAAHTIKRPTMQNRRSFTVPGFIWLL